jgi:hypothetical protein
LPGIYYVWVYDNNHHGDANRYIDLNINNNTWTYDTGGVGIWSGGPNPGSIYILPLSIHNEQFSCSWCNNTLSNNIPAISLTLNGTGHLLINDSQGRRLGFVGAQYFEEIPGGYGLVPVLGTDNASEPIYTLPLTDTYNILLDGQTITETTSDSLAQFGPGYAISLDGLMVSSTTQDYFNIAEDGSQIEYHASQNQEPTITFALDSLGNNYSLEVQGVDIASSEAVTLSTDRVSGNLLINGSRSSGGEYNLSIHIINSTQNENFYHADIPILASDTHKIDFGSWNGFDFIALQIDHGSDGSFEETIYLKNQKFIFLPVVVLNR